MAGKLPPAPLLQSCCCWALLPALGMCAHAPNGTALTQEPKVAAVGEAVGMGALLASQLVATWDCPMPMAPLTGLAKLEQLQALAHFS